MRSAFERKRETVLAATEPFPSVYPEPPPAVCGWTGEMKLTGIPSRSGRGT